MLKNESDLEEIEELVYPSKKPGQRAVMFALFYSTPWPTEAFLLLFPISSLLCFLFVLLHAFTMSRMMRPPYVDPQTNMIFDVNEPDFQGWCVVAYVVMFLVAAVLCKRSRFIIHSRHHFAFFVHS